MRRDRSAAGLQRGMPRRIADSQDSLADAQHSRLRPGIEGPRLPLAFLKRLNQKLFELHLPHPCSITAPGKEAAWPGTRQNWKVQVNQGATQTNHKGIEAPPACNGPRYSKS